MELRIKCPPVKAASLIASVVTLTTFTAHCMEPAADSTRTPTRRGRQLRLFAEANPLGLRFGTEFFRGLPARPGVYFFHDAAGALLYIGQSVDLRARVGSYRHVSPERHPKRTLRMVHRIARIEWRECGSAADAVELERALLLEKRPPFNRAGTWPGHPWWLSVSADEHHVETRLVRHASGDGCCVGPLPSGYRHVHGSLMRCVYRLLHPDHHLAMYPHGLLRHPGPLQLRLHTGEAARVAASVMAFARREEDGLLVELQSILEGALPLELEFWATELETLGKFLTKPKPAPVLSLPPPPMMAALPLFPDWC